MYLTACAVDGLNLQINLVIGGIEAQFNYILNLYAVHAAQLFAGLDACVRCQTVLAYTTNKSYHYNSLKKCR